MDSFCYLKINKSHILDFHKEGHIYSIHKFKILNVYTHNTYNQQGKIGGRNQNSQASLVRVGTSF